MKRKSRLARTAAILSSLLAVGLLVSGCGLTKSYVQIQYHPVGGAQKVSGADGTTFHIDVVDQRTVKDHIGRKGNEYSFLGPIIATNDVADVIARAIEIELVRRGFVLGNGSVQIIVELSRFYAEYQTSLVSENIVGEIVMGLKVKNADGSILYGKMITAQGSENGGLVRGGNDTKLALEKALQEAISELVNDPSFIEAILKTKVTPQIDK